MSTIPLADEIGSQREAVKRTMEQATENEPASFRDEANETKLVEVGKDLTDQPIQGIDPQPGSAESRAGDQQDAGSAPDEERLARIRAAALAAWERRGRQPGQELEDWLEAERTLYPGPDGRSSE